VHFVCGPATLEGLFLGVVEAPEPGEHEREPEQRPPDQRRAIIRLARVRQPLLERRQRAPQVIAHPLRHAERHRRPREGDVVVHAFGDGHCPPGRVLGLGHPALDPVRLGQLHQS